MNKPIEKVTATWVYGKVHPGWYMARCIWVTEYSDDLKAMGYDVEMSAEKPTRSPVF